MTESGGGGLGARFFSGLGAIGNILRLSSGSQNIPNEVIASDEDDDAIAVHDELPGQRENLEDEIAPATIETNLPEIFDEGIEYEGQIIRDMKIGELKSALKREGILSESRMTKKQCVNLLEEDSRKKSKLTTNFDVIDHIEGQTAKRRPVRSTPRKELKTVVETSASVSKMTTRRSAAALGPPSSNLRHRSPPPAPTTDDKRKASTRTPSAKVESSAVSSKRDRKKSHIYDDYELSGTATKSQVTVAPTSTKKAASARKKKLTVEKVVVSNTVSKAFDGRSVVGLDEIGIDRAYGANMDEDDAEEDAEEESVVASPEHKGTPKVMSRADYELSLKKKADVPEPILMEEYSSDGNAVEESKSTMPPGHADSDSQYMASKVLSKVALDAFVNGSEDESFVDQDYPDNSIPNRDEDGADADAEDEEGEDEEEDEEDKFAAPYDEEAEGDDEYENTAGEEEEIESEAEGITEIPKGFMIAPIEINGNANVDVQHPGTDEEEVGEEEEGEEGQEGEEGGEEEDEEESIQPTLLSYVPPSSIKAAIAEVVELHDEEEEEDEGMVDEEEWGGEEESDIEEVEVMDEVQEEVMDEENEEEEEEEEGVIDLISSDDEVEGDGPDDDGGNDSFLTADTNDPASVKVSLIPPQSDVTTSLPTSVSVAKEVVPDGDAVLEAVNTVLNAFKGTLSNEDFKQLEVMMRKRKERPGDHTASPSDTLKAPSSSSPTDNGDQAPAKKRMDRESRLSGDGSSWTSRESFLPPTPRDRFVAREGAGADESSSVVDLQGSGKNGGSINMPSTSTHSGNRGVGVRFQDDAASNGEAVRSHIRYGPVTFSRRPMTPFARKTVASPSPSPSPFNRNSDITSSSASSFNNRQSLGASLPYPSTEEVQRKRRFEESAIYSASAGSYDDREVSEAKRVNFGQARYSVSNYEQTRTAFAPLDSRYGLPILSSVTPGSSMKKTSFSDSSFSIGSNMTGSRISQSPYTPTLRDSNSSGKSTGILLQPSQPQSQTKRASLSFAQRRLNQRLSLSSSAATTSSKNAGTPSSSSADTSTSAFASASVAKRILDSLSELQTPMEEARHRPTAVAAALSASKEAIIRSRIVPEDTTFKTPTFTFAPPMTLTMASAAPVKELTSTVMTFPTWPSVGQAAVAAAMAPKPFSLPVPEVKAVSAGFGGAGGVGGGFQFLASIPTKVPPPVPYTPTLPQITISTPKTSIVRFVEPDSEFTFGEPSVVEGLDPEEVEKILTPGDKKRDERMKFAFSPPGKMCRSVEKSRKSLGQGQGQGGVISSSQSVDSKAIVQDTSKSVQNAPLGESLWSKAATAAADFQKCPSCFVQNSNTASSCVSCESTLKASGPAQPVADFFSSKSTPSTPAPFQFAAPSAAANKSLSAPVPAITVPVAGSLWAVAASADVVKCMSCFVQNPKGTLKCLSCENVLEAVSEHLKSAAAPISTAAPFSFNAPVSINSAVKPFSGVTMPDSGSVPTTSTSFKFGSTPSAAPFGASLTVPPVSAVFTGFSTSVAAPPTKGFGLTVPSANPFGDSSNSITIAAAPSSSGAGTGTGVMSFGASRIPASDDKKSPAMFSFGAPVSIAQSSAPSNSFSGFGGLPLSAPSVTTAITDAQRITPITATPAVSIPVVSVAPTASPAPFAFGSIPSTSSTSLPPASFTSPAFTFGAPAAATPAFQFGTSATVATKQPEAMSTFVTPAFSFGSVAAPAAPSTTSSSAPFTFGAPSPFTFGATAVPQTSTPSNSSYSSSTAVHGMDSPNSTMDTGYASGDASTVGYPPVTMPTTFGGPAVPFTFGAPATGPVSHSQPPSFGTSLPFSNAPAAYSLPSSAQPFTFGALQQAPSQPNFGSGSATVGGAAFSQPMSAPFMFGASPAGNIAGNFSSQGMGAPPSGGGFSMGATDSQRSANTTRKKVKAKRPVGQ